jgi:hypothetical protein
MQFEENSKSPLWVGLGPKGLLAAVLIGSAVFAPVVVNPTGSEIWSMLLLVVATLVYVAFGIFNDRGKFWLTVIQALVAIGLVSLAVLLDSQWVVAIGLIAHAIWDGFHLKRDQRYVPWWYAGACIYVDLIAAAFLLINR